MDDKLAEAREELDKEFRQVRENLDSIRDALEKVTSAGPEDDLYGLLEVLEDTVKQVRTGGVIGSGGQGAPRGPRGVLQGDGHAVVAAQSNSQLVIGVARTASRKITRAGRSEAAPAATINGRRCSSR